jgi:ferredoxin
MHRTGSLLGPESYAVERLYRAAGLAIAGSELPDHASLELSFLAYLAVQREKHPAQERQWRRLERAFLRKHAGRWLPHLGSALAATGDVVYAPIGHLLADWLQEVSRSRPRRRTKRATTRLPVLTQAEACTLCGFCVQACPSGALTIDESRRETTLQLSPARCNACGRCERICRPGTLQLKRAPTAAAPLTLRRSPRARCPDCGAPTVSQAELKYVTEQIGPAPWLARCPDCRVQ